jgi:hypothetical protein
MAKPKSYAFLSPLHPVRPDLRRTKHLKGTQAETRTVFRTQTAADQMQMQRTYVIAIIRNRTQWTHRYGSFRHHRAPGYNGPSKSFGMYGGKEPFRDWLESWHVRR